jgi:HK97 family phage major capsid protein
MIMSDITKEDVRKQLLDLAGSELTGVIGDIVDKRLEDKAKAESAKSVPEALIKASAQMPTNTTEKGLDFARALKAAAVAKGDPEKALAFAEKTYGKDSVVTKTMLAGLEAAGGAFVPVSYSDDVIELLRPASVIRSLNPLNPPLINGNLTLPAITGGASASYIGEAQPISATGLTTGQVKFVAKKLAALIPMSNECVRYSNPRLDAIVRDDAIAALGQTSDISFIRGVGSEYSPRGLRYLAASGNIFNANATVNLANVTIDLGNAILKLWSNNVRMLRPGWIMAPRTAMYLMTLRDGNGNFAFKDEMAQGRLMMFPYKVSTQIPINLGSGTNETEIYLADFADVVIAEDLNLEVTISNEASFVDGTGATISAFQRDMTLVKVLQSHDFNIRHIYSVAVLTGVKWGA